MLARVICTAAIAFGLVATGLAQAQDKAAPKAAMKAATKVLLDNDKVLVTQSTIPPGAVTKTNRKDRTNYIVKGSELQRTTPEGKVTKYVRKTGDAHWLKADSDEVKNIGKSTFVVVTVVNK